MVIERADPYPGAVRWYAASTGGGLILPDGCMDLIHLGDRMVVAGPDSHAWQATPLGVPATGLRLPPGVLPGLLGVAAEELRDRRVDLADLLGRRRAVALSEAVSRSGADALSRFAWSRTGASAWEAQRTRGLVERIRQGIPVATIAREWSLSERQFRRKCLRDFGYGPATLRRILRLNLALGHHRAGVPLAGAALEAGFADQAHFTRTCSELTGLSPAALVREPPRETQFDAAYRSTPLPSGS